MNTRLEFGEYVGAKEDRLVKTSTTVKVNGLNRTDN